MRRPPCASWFASTGSAWPPSAACVHPELRFGGNRCVRAACRTSVISCAAALSRPGIPFDIPSETFNFTACPGSERVGQFPAEDDTIPMNRFQKRMAPVMDLRCRGGCARAGLVRRPAKTCPPLDQILKEVEKRYTGSQFAAEFLQESTIKTMEITDFASGRLYVRYPGMMRWEYEKPERQVIITDGTTLWIFRPQDNLVMTGNAPVFFRDGKGASFLSDISLVRKKFKIVLARAEGEYLYELKMTPIERTMNVSRDPAVHHPTVLQHCAHRDAERPGRRHAHRHHPAPVQRQSGAVAVQLRHPARRRRPENRRLTA